MELLLLRHANADVPADSDAERPLSEKGIKQAKRVGLFCLAHELEPDLILSSPLLRARQTAELFAEAFKRNVPQIAPFLSSGMSPDQALEELRAYESFERVLLVGHEPDFSLLAAHLLGLPNHASFHVRKASLALFHLTRLRPAMATLEFSIPSALMETL